MKVVVTGAGGFIGSHICEWFRENGHNVIGWDIVTKKLRCPVKIVDLLDEAAIDERLKEDFPDIIIHCAGAADVGKSMENPSADYSANVTATHNLLFSTHKAGLGKIRIIFMSSAAVYGNVEQLPISEETKLNPLSPYALHKVMCEEICKYMYNNYNMDIKILRIFSAYGEGLKKQIFWDMYRKYRDTNKLEMFGTGNESRDYINIHDLINAISLVALKAPKEECVYNIANGEEITIRFATECFADAIGVDRGKISFTGKEKTGNPTNWHADVSKLLLLGYNKNIDLKQGVVVR